MEMPHMKGRLCKIHKIPLRCYGHVEKMKNQRRPKHTATATMVGISKNDHEKR
jgi:hypothetical protein